MTEKEKCDAALNVLFPHQFDLQQKWWNSPNKAFDMQTPQQTFAEEPKCVVQYLLGQFNGDYS